MVVVIGRIDLRALPFGNEYIVTETPWTEPGMGLLESDRHTGDIYFCFERTLRC